MLQEFKFAPAVYQPSDFWQALNKFHMTQLSTLGFANFKRTVNMRYFNWSVFGIMVHQLSIVWYELMKGNLYPLYKSQLLKSKKIDDDKQFNLVTKYIYHVYVASFADHISRLDHLCLLEKLKEPTLGNPYIISYQGKQISQDLCNSLHELYSIINYTGNKIRHVAELGAGYGRLAYVFLKVFKNSSYCVIDIPPALYISQKYLSQLFPKEKIFHFRSFASFRSIKAEFESARIRFLMPHQLELLPNNSFDLFINISSLHEMKRKPIKNYLLQINRLCNGFFYTKQWIRSIIKENNHISHDNYPIPKAWIQIYKRIPHPIQKMFFDALFQTNHKKSYSIH